MLPQGAKVGEQRKKGSNSTEECLEDPDHYKILSRPQDHLGNRRAQR